MSVQELPRKAFTQAAAAREHILAGRARITIRSKATGTRYTYRIVRDKYKATYYVSVLFGQDNETDYAYIGILTEMKGFFGTKGSKVKLDDPRFKAFQYAWKNAAADAIPSNLEIWHEGRCGRCGRALTVPESVERGIGPECAGKLGIFCEEAA